MDARLQQQEHQQRSQAPAPAAVAAATPAAAAQAEDAAADAPAAAVAVAAVVAASNDRRRQEEDDQVLRSSSSVRVLPSQIRSQYHYHCQSSLMQLCSCWNCCCCPIPPRLVSFQVGRHGSRHPIPILRKCCCRGQEAAAVRSRCCCEVLLSPTAVVRYCPSPPSTMALDCSLWLAI